MDRNQRLRSHNSGGKRPSEISLLWPVVKCLMWWEEAWIPSSVLGILESNGGTGLLHWVIPSTKFLIYLGEDPHASEGWFFSHSANLSESNRTSLAVDSQPWILDNPGLGPGEVENWVLTLFPPLLLPDFPCPTHFPVREAARIPGQGPLSIRCS